MHTTDLSQKISVVTADVSTSPTSAARHVDETFTMLQHVCDTHLDRYDWFVRAVDDAYLRPQKLLQALAYVDKRKKVLALTSGFLIRS